MKVSMAVLHYNSSLYCGTR